MQRHDFRIYILAITVAIFFSQFANAQNELLNVAASLKKSEGKVTAYYPASIEKQAKSIQGLLEKAVDYYNKQLNINFPITVVLFGPEEFERFTKEKYGKADPYNEFLPFVTSGPPKVMCLPAMGGSALDSLTQMALKKSPSLTKKLNLSIPEISQRFTALVGLHELGHQYIGELEICQAVHWFQEMMANYIADAFLTDLSPTDALIWQVVNEAYETNLMPANRTFSGIHKGNQENYVWWQGNISRIAHEVYMKYGLDFLQKLKKLSNVKIYHEDDLAFIIALDEIAPGFEQWAGKYGHITTADKIQMDSMSKNIREETKIAIAQNMPNLYTSIYSNQWEKGNTSYNKTVMRFLKDFETADFKQTDEIADYIEINFMGVDNFFEKATAITKLKEIRSGFRNLKIRLQSVIPIKSADSNEDWVFVTGNMITTQENGTLKNIDFFQQFSFTKDGKIRLIKQYELASQ
ncbi:hypothetical protein [Flavihumibacter profundi]|uniref:hypothetical protein n=1 Tax=Flavihumibacter profundi TaxID=2716883 RepID=UPI001CC5822C|nr:hypothetical protein [Flavihumibacter profundi]MBZ5858140.1 hypothetical protein [Flavihumibacter profundi]